MDVARKGLKRELMRLAELEETRAVFKCGVYEVLKLLVQSIETLFDKFEEEQTLKKAMVRNLWTVLRPNITEGKFEKVTEQPWASGLKLGTHRLRTTWVEKRFHNLDEQGFPKPLTEDKLPESQLDASYNVEPGNLNELSTWKLMAEKGEMTEEALRHCSRMPFMEYEVSGLLDFEGLEEAKELLISPKQQRIKAGIDPMLTRQGLTPEERRLKNKRRIQRLEEKKKCVTETLEKMRQLQAEGYDARQIAMRLITPHMGKKVSTQRRKLSIQEKAKNRVSQGLVRRKAAKAKAEAKAKAKAKAKAMAKSPEDSVELEEAAEEACVLPEEACVKDTEEQWEDS